MKFNAVIFDLDGTLLNTLEDIADSINKVLQKNNLPLHSIDSYRYFIGDGIKKLVEHVLPVELRKENFIKDFLSECKNSYEKNCINKTRLYDGVDELLSHLTKLSIRMSILSNKPDKMTKYLVEQLLKKWNFEIVLGESPKFPPKPDPTSARFIAGEMNIDIKKIIYLGDSLTDMKTAIAAEMFPAGAVWGFRTEEELKQYGAKALLQHPLDLLKLF